MATPPVGSTAGESWLELFERSRPRRPQLSDTQCRPVAWLFGPLFARHGWSVAGPVLVLTAAAFIFQVHVVLWDPCEACPAHFSFARSALGPVQVACGLAAAWLSAAAPGEQLRQMALVALLNWVGAFLDMFKHCLMFLPGVHHGVGFIVLDLFQNLSVVVTVERAWVLAQQRVLALGTAAALRAHRVLRLCMRAGVINALVALAVNMCLSHRGFAEDLLPKVAGVLFWMLVSILWTIVGFMSVALNDGRKMAKAAANSAREDRQAQEARLAAASARDQVGALVLCSGSTVVRIMLIGVVMERCWPLDLAHNEYLLWAQAWMVVLDYLANCGSALWLSGAFRSALDAARLKQSVEDGRAARYAAAAGGWRPHDEPAWHSKVCELALRGLSLEALLDFYSSLGEDRMCHFCARFHTTADVVRRGIVPASAAAASALAPLLMDGQPTRPVKMVTHNWGNLFRDLVAAICADALDEDEFGPIAYLLEHDFNELRRILRREGKLDRTYWVCAFSVNQHVTICDANPHDGRDSVTGELYPLCRCGAPKVFNDAAPRTHEGRSIDCEVNKFDCMMKALAASDPGFEQVVAIDGKFELFRRAWCVAELAAANTMGMRQCLKFRTASRLAKQEPELRNLKIRNMEASRPEDKDEILKAIPDPDTFDANLQHMLFQEMLPTWHRMDALDQLRRLAKLARWQQVAHRRRSAGIWSAAGGVGGDLLVATCTSSVSGAASELPGRGGGELELQLRGEAVRGAEGLSTVCDASVPLVTSD